MSGAACLPPLGLEPLGRELEAWPDACPTLPSTRGPREAGAERRVGGASELLGQGDPPQLGPTVGTVEGPLSPCCAVARGGCGCMVGLGLKLPPLPYPALVRGAMESLQHVRALELQLQVRPGRGLVLTLPGESTAL